MKCGSIIITLLVLLIPYVLSIEEGEGGGGEGEVDLCKDHKSLFTVTSDTDGTITQTSCVDARNDPNLCSIQTIRTNCKYTCYNCCEDNPQTFRQIYPDLIYQTPKSCSMIETYPELCEKSKTWRDECPRSCGVCPCIDNPSKFSRRKYGVVLRSCSMANTNRCKKDLFRFNCPRSCNICPVPKIFPSNKCEIDAILSFPELNDVDYYGYSSD